MFICLVAASAGLIADARTWVERARNESQSYFFVYGQKIRVEDVTMKVFLPYLSTFCENFSRFPSLLCILATMTPMYQILDIFKNCFYILDSIGTSIWCCNAFCRHRPHRASSLPFGPLWNIYQMSGEGDWRWR